MNDRGIFLALCCCTLAACQGGDGSTVGSPAVVASTPPFPSDEAILAKAYDPLFQVPDTFLVDDRANTPGSYSLHHVQDNTGNYELCSDEFAEALAWEAADNESQPVRGPLTGSLETDKYFEFVRDLSFGDSVGNISNPTSPGFARVFKCSYVNRTGVNRNMRDGDAGILGSVGSSAAQISEFSEYMWQFTFFWPASKTVLDTFSAETANTYQHTLMVALVASQGEGRCDLVTVVDWVFSVNKNDGRISKDFMPIYELEAQRDANGDPVKCGV